MRVPVERDPQLPDERAVRFERAALGDGDEVGGAGALAVVGAHARAPRGAALPGFGGDRSEEGVELRPP